MEGRTSISWTLLQGAAIVASILLAFAIQAWWDERQESQEAERLLLAVAAEYDHNLKAIEADNRYRMAMKEAINGLFALASSTNTRDPERVDQLLGTLTWAATAQVTWTAFDALAEGGNLKLIENAKLRESLLALHQFKREYEVREEYSHNYAQSVVYTYFREKALLPQIAQTDTALTQPGGNGKILYEYPHPLTQRRDHSALLDDPVFLGLLTEKLWIQFDFEELNRRFIENAEAAKALLVEEVD